MLKRTSLMASIIAMAVLPTVATAAPHGVKIGVLNCHVQSGWGYIVGSSKQMTCEYHPNHGEDDHYVGSISKIGVDVGYTGSGNLVWDVVAPTSDMRAGALEGDYAGASASATVAAGLGAHVMLGGFDKSIALQPVSFEINTGLDVSAGIGEMTLNAAAPAPAAYLPPRGPAAQTSADATPPTVKFVVNFAFDRSELSRDARATIRDAATDARKADVKRIQVSGNTDYVGSDGYNASLSLRRAEVVKAELVHDGIDRRAITVSGSGFHEPVVETGPGVRERENRRVTIDLQAEGEQRQASR